MEDTQHLLNKTIEKIHKLVKENDYTPDECQDLTNLIIEENARLCNEIEKSNMKIEYLSEILRLQNIIREQDASYQKKLEEELDRLTKYQDKLESSPLIMKNIDYNMFFEYIEAVNETYKNISECVKCEICEECFMRKYDN